jgi:hypothetical protein
MPFHPGHQRPDPHTLQQRDQRLNQLRQQEQRDAGQWRERRRKLEALKKKVDDLKRLLEDDRPRGGSLGAIGRKEIKKKSEARSQQFIKLVKQWREYGGKMDHAHLKGGGELVTILIVLVTVGHALWPRVQALLAGALDWSDEKLDRVLGRMKEIDREVTALER